MFGICREVSWEATIGDLSDGKKSWCLGGREMSFEGASPLDQLAPKQLQVGHRLSFSPPSPLASSWSSFSGLPSRLENCQSWLDNIIGDQLTRERRQRRQVAPPPPMSHLFQSWIFVLREKHIKKTFYKNISSGFLFSEDDWLLQFDIVKGKTYPRVDFFVVAKVTAETTTTQPTIGIRQANSKLWPNSSNLLPNIENDAVKQSAVAELTPYLTWISTICNSITNFTVGICIWYDSQSHQSGLQNFTYKVTRSGNDQTCVR